MKKFIDSVKKYSKFIIGAMVIIILGLLVNSVVREKPQAPQEEVPLVETPVETPTAPKPVSRPSTGNTGTPTVVDTRTYSDLVLAYKDRTIQFNAECQMPVLPVKGFKKGTDILLDNRSASPATISLGGTRHSLSSYGYKVVSLDTVGSFQVDCNDRKNVTTITVQN